MLMEEDKVLQLIEEAAERKQPSLDLSGNQLTALPPEITKLTNLTRLYLTGNQLTALPPEIVELGLEIKWERELWFSGVTLEGNPLETPPIEIVKKGREAVIDYFKSLEGEKRALNEVKVLLVGDGGAGKTSLVKQLLGEEFDEKESQTHGINIRKWKVEEGENEINVNFWDFGGQEIMHATHQFFLSKRSLYILVLDGRKEEKTEYWLKHIESFGGDSPVVVVLNKMDENPGFDVNRKFLQDKYPSIKGFYRVSCKKHAGIKDFCENLKKALTKIEHLRTTWAINWFDVKTQLENMADNFISYETYKEMCDRENITEKSAQDTLVDFLNDLGVILHFKDFPLLDTHVLEPKWVTEAVYKVINSEKVAESKGILKLNLLDEILKKEKETDYYYPRDRYRYIIDLMMKFELCYELDRETVLLPDLLEVQEPEFDFDYANSLKFLIEYDFFPRSVMPRFIVKKNKEIQGELRWRTGVVLEDTAFKSITVVKSDDDAKKIYIHVDGVQKRDYFSAILSTLRGINRSFEKLKFTEKVPMPDHPEITVSYEHLIRLERRGIREYMPDGSENVYNVKDLLGTIYSENKTEEEILQILRGLKEKSDTEDTLLEKAEDIVILQPNFMGVGIDVKKAIKKLFR
jgi:small GTP-binding protein